MNRFTCFHGVLISYVSVLRFSALHWHARWRSVTGRGHAGIAAVGGAASSSYVRKVTTSPLLQTARMADNNQLQRQLHIFDTANTN